MGHTFRSQNSSPQSVGPHFQIPKQLKSPKGYTFRSQNLSPQSVGPHFQIPKQLKSPKGHTFRSQNLSPQSVGHTFRSQNSGPTNFASISDPRFQVSISHHVFCLRTKCIPPKLRSQFQVPNFRLSSSGKPTRIPKFKSQSQFMCFGAVHSGPQIQVPISDQSIYRVQNSDPKMQVTISNHV